MYLKLFATGHASTYYSIIIDWDWQKSKQFYSNSCFNKVNQSFWNLGIKENTITHTFLDKVMLFVFSMETRGKKIFLDPFPIKDLVHFFKLSSADRTE